MENLKQLWLNIMTGVYIFYLALTRENLTLLHANHIRADHPAHSHCLISTFVIHSLISNIYKLATCKVSILQLVSVAEKNG